MKTAQKNTIDASHPFSWMLFFICSVVSLSSLSAQTWTGLGGNDNWTTGANWSTTPNPPLNNNTADIVFSGSTRLNPLVNTAQSVNRITFDSAASSFNLGGSSTLTLFSEGNLTTTAALVNNSSNTQTFSTNLAFGTTNRSYYFYANTAGLNINGNLAATNQRIVVGNNGTAHDISISGVFSGSGSAGQSLLLNTTFLGTLTLSGANDYTGPTEIRRGTLVANNDTALGASSSLVRMGTNAALTTPASLFIGGEYSIQNEIKVFNQPTGSYTIGGNSAHASTYAGIITLGDTGGKALELTAASGGSVSFTNNILTSTSGSDDNDALTKTGEGTVIIAGAANTYSGTTTVSAGTLLFNGAFSVAGQGFSVESGATLGGSGEIDRNVSVAANATLLGGTGQSASGALSINGDLNLADDSVISLVLGPGAAHSSLIREGGTWVFDQEQTFTFNLGASAGTYTGIVSGLTGTESGLSNIANWIVANPEYAGSTFSYDAGQVSLHLIPEPRIAVLLFGLLGALLGLIRTSRGWNKD